jgi:hypothetical protein
MQIDRTTIVSGPAIVTFGGQTFCSKGDVTVKPSHAKFDVTTSRFGKGDSRYSSKTFEVSFEPDGRFTSALAAVLWPYASTDIGASIYGATDSALVVHGRDGKKITIHTAAITEMPVIRLGVTQTIQGSCKFVGLLANNTDPSAAAAYYTIASAAYPGDTGWAASDILTKGVSAAWGLAAPWDSFAAEAGWEISFELQLADQLVDGLGVVSKTFQGLSVMAKAIPVGPAMADVLAKMSDQQPLGSSIQGQAEDLIISATGIYAAVYNASIVDTDFGWGESRKRVGQTTWQATRTVTAGVADPLFYIGTAAPA